MCCLVHYVILALVGVGVIIVASFVSWGMIFGIIGVVGRCGGDIMCFGVICIIIGGVVRSLMAFTVVDGITYIWYFVDGIVDR